MTKENIPEKKEEEKNNNSQDKIIETFKREDEKILKLESQMKELTLQVKQIEKKIPEKKQSLFSKIILIILILSISYGGYWFYNQEDKSKALTQVGDAIIEQKNALSQKISQASTNISNAKIQEEIDALNHQNTLFRQENKVLRDEISRLILESDQRKNDSRKNKAFMISQLESQIDFLQKGETKITTKEKTEDVQGDKKTIIPETAEITTDIKPEAEEIRESKKTEEEQQESTNQDQIKETSEEIKEENTNTEKNPT